MPRFKKGEGYWLGKKRPETTRQKISKTNKGHKTGMLGKHHSEETKRKIGLAGLGHHRGGGFKKGFTPWNKGKHTNMIPRSAFKKGHTPWSKGTKGVVKGWGKGKKRPQLSGANSPSWKGGRLISNGYIYISKHDHPFCNKAGYTKRVRLVMEKHLGRYLEKGEIVHHKGTKYPMESIKNKQDDRLKNLQLFPNRNEHTRFHMILRHSLVATAHST